MSGECGYPRLPSPGLTKTVGRKTEEISKAASATLEKLNLLMKQMNNWRDERLELESKIRSLKAALQKFGKNPEETLKPDPLIVHQREEINRLELTRDRLEDKVKGLRVALLEADQAITCSGAKRLKEKMRKIREEGANEVRKLKDEIGHLKLRVQEAEDDSSCSAFSRLRIKLREILNGDKKIERIIADVASRSCGTVIDLSNELTRIKEMLDESRLENIKLHGESRRLKAALESAPCDGEPTSGCSGYLETIERLSFHVKELERKIKEFEDDSGLVKRLEEMEGALNVSQKKLEDHETVVTSLRNELLGAKAAYKLKSIELTEFKDSKKDVMILKTALDERVKHVTDLERELEQSASKNKDMERLRDELKRVRSELLNLEIERDGLLDEIEKTRGIVSDRNEHIVKILEDNEERDKARKSEIESVKTKLCIASSENERIKSRCKNLEDELAVTLVKLNEIKASGDSRPLLKKIKRLEEEVNLLKENSNFLYKTDLDNSNDVLKFEEMKSRLENELSIVKSKNVFLRSKLDEEISAKNVLIGKTKDYRKENDLLKLELEKLAAKFLEELSKLKQTKNQREHKNIQIDDDSKSLLEKLNDEMKKELEKLNDSKTANDESIENLTKELERSMKAFDNLKLENEKLKTSLNNEMNERIELVLGMEKLRFKVEEQSRTMSDVENKSEKFSRVSKTRETRETLVMDCDDYIRADKELKYYIHLQSLAIKRVVDFISYLDGKTSSKPAMATFPEPTKTNFMLLNFDKNITTTFRMSQKLSETIYEAETKVQKLENIRNERINLKGMKKLKKIFASNFAEDISMPYGVLQAMKEDYSVRVLKSEIESRLIEMRETMRQERIRLMEIADRANVPPSEQLRTLPIYDRTL